MKNLFILLFFSLTNLLSADDSLPDKKFTADRYQTLWTKSPFIVATVATPNAPVAAPSQYKLVGVSRFSGIGYANIIDSSSPSAPGIFLEQYKPHQFGDKSLVLIGIEPGQPGQVCGARITEDGKVIELKTEPNKPAGGPTPNVLNSTLPLPPQAPLAPPRPPKIAPPQVVIKNPTRLLPNQPNAPNSP